MIPEEKTDSVRRALRGAFGVSEYEDIQLITIGLSSALVFRITVKGRRYLLRVITRTDAMGDPTRQFSCMAAGDAAGLAPHVRYTSIEERISITDFVDALPFPMNEAAPRLAATLRTLHALPPFHRAWNYMDFVAGFIRKFQAANILPAEETAEVFRRYAGLTAVYRHEAEDMVACHNDLKPENILFDGDRVWLVDWEAAALNDRYADLAIVANFAVTNEVEEGAYLENYFGEPAGEYRLARFCLMRQIMHMSYAMVFLFLGSSGKAIEPHLEVPDFRVFHNRMWAGEINLKGNEARVEYGRVHLRRLLQNLRSARYEEALRIVAAK